MLLVFLLIFAFLTLEIVQQVERSAPGPEPAPGRCPGCGGRVEADWLICPRCREMLLVRCRGCDQRMPVYHAFCTECGAARPSSFGATPDDQQI